MDLKYASSERDSFPAFELLVMQRPPVHIPVPGQEFSRLRPAIPVEPSVWLT
jgi:hypothetical protein